MHQKKLIKKLLWRIVSIPYGEMTLQTRNGLLTFNTRDRVLGKALFSFRNYEWDTIVAVMESLRDHSRANRPVMVDIGANIGMISIACLKNGYFKQAVAFEPDPYNFSLLQRNVRQNNLAPKIECVHSALSSRTGNFPLEISRENFGDHRLRLNPPSSSGFFREEKRKTISVQTVKFDEWFSSRPDIRDSIGLVWADIQGHEGHFLEGARQTFASGIPLACEFWPYALNRAGTSKEQFLGLVQELFSGFFHILPGGAPNWADIKTAPGLYELYRFPREMGTVLFV
jgi:FkbM family methyltransferase